MRQRVLPVLLAVSCALATLGESAAESRVDLVSRGVPSGASDTANGASGIPAPSRRVWSADGRWLVFTSRARDLVPGQLDRDETEDVFLYDRTTGSRSLVSRRAGSVLTTPNAPSTDPVISADGRWIAFVSDATDLVAGQVDSNGLCSPNETRDVFLHDRITGTTFLVSHTGHSLLTASGCSSAPALSADGGVVAFQQDSNVYLYDRPSGEVTLVSHKGDNPNEEALGRSPSVSADGRFVVFVSRTQDLVPGQVDPLWGEDVFLYDRDTGTTLLVSHAAGAPLSAGDGGSNVFFLTYIAAAVSPDGRWVAFSNSSSNLVPGQAETPTESMDVFLWDRTTDTTILVSRSSASPAQAIAGFLVDLSSDGGSVIFGRGSAGSGDPAAGGFELHLFSRDSGSNVLVNQAAGSPGTAGNGWISDATVSADGRFVAFRSAATDLVAGAIDTNEALDVFLFDRLGSGLTLVSHAAGSSTTAVGSESETPRISPDGAFIAFGNPGNDLVTAVDLNEGKDVFLHDRTKGTNGLVSQRDPDMFQETPHGASAVKGLSADGRFVVFTTGAVDVVPGLSDVNGGGTDVFLWDRDTGVRTLVSRSASTPSATADNASVNPAISADGRWVVFQSQATDLLAGQVDANGLDDVFLWDRTTGAMRLVSGSGGSATQAASGLSSQPVISADGRWIAFLSSAGDLIAGQATTVPGVGAYLWDRDTGTTLLASRREGSAFQGVDALEVALSADGSFVAFVSPDSQVVPGQVDTDITWDVFLFSRATGQVELVSHASTSLATASNSYSLGAVLSADGSRVAFASYATDLVPGQVDDGSDLDVFLWTRGAGASLLVSRRAGSVAETADSFSTRASISADGRFVVFESPATNLVAGQVDWNGWDYFNGEGKDVFLFDAATGSMTLVSRRAGTTNETGGQSSRSGAISADGLSVAFRSSARDLLPEKLPGFGWNVFVFDRLSGRARLASRTPDSPIAPGDFDNTAEVPRIGAGGSYVAFTSRSSNLVPGDFNQQEDAFLFSDPPVASDFFLVAPCRLFDTRLPEDGPALVSGVPVLLEVDGGCGIPATARALALNVTVWQPAGGGSLTLYPGDSARPGTSTVNFTAGLVRANNTIIALALDGTGTLGLHAAVSGGGTVDIILDVVGYFE